MSAENTNAGGGERYTVPKADHRRRIQALGAAISRRYWNAVERAHAEIRDAFDRPDIYDPAALSAHSTGSGGVAAEPVAFYERTLDSFHDAIITTIRKGENDLWYAVLDRGYDPYISTDFSTCAETPEQAVAWCAAKIRADQRGEGKFAPHGCMEADGYDFRWKLCKWWSEKERLLSMITAPSCPLYEHPPVATEPMAGNLRDVLAPFAVAWQSCQDLGDQGAGYVQDDQDAWVSGNRSGGAHPLFKFGDLRRAAEALAAAPTPPAGGGEKETVDAG